jgi:hypothetical protein
VEIIKRRNGTKRKVMRTNINKERTRGKEHKEET